jgi:glucose/arabinose dehydrogenase
MNRDGTDVQEFARGLRNAVFFDWDPVTGEMWATEMGRDFLGDDLPPDEVNIVGEGLHYGWPFCYGRSVRDEMFRAGAVPETFCTNTEPAHIEIPAHSAPLGLAFVPEEGWPEEMWLDLLIAYHGSWNRTEPTGYKIVRFELNSQSREEMGVSDFITGWIEQGEREAHGRPVDLHIFPGGVLYITDDHAGVIYRLTWQGQR